jgi:uncharacterized protein (DUF1697 family)
VHTWAVLLRGVNVGGKNPVPMLALREAFASWGFIDPATYIASGNVVMGSRSPKTSRSAATIERKLAATFGYHARVVVRDAREIAAIVRAIPADWDPTDATTRRYVLFLTDHVTSHEFLRTISPRPEFETVTGGPSAVFWSAPIATLTRTTMNRLSAHPAYPEMTIRNIRTTLTVAEMVRARARAYARAR